MTPRPAYFADALSAAEKVRQAYRVRYAQVLPSTMPGMVRLRIGKGEFKVLSVSEALHAMRMAKRRERAKLKGKKP